jgi:hypothetical protein
MALKERNNALNALEHLSRVVRNAPLTSSGEASRCLATLLRETIKGVLQCLQNCDVVLADGSDVVIEALDRYGLRLVDKSVEGVDLRPLGDPPSTSSMRIFIGVPDTSLGMP